MRRAIIVEHLSASELKNRMVNSQSREQFQRWQAIFLVATRGFKAEDVADMIGLAAGTIHQLVHTYNHQGPESIDLSGRGGRRSSFLDLKGEEALLEDLAEMAEKGGVVIAQTVRKYAEKRLGHRVSKDYAYDLLHRHGWRKVAPRPKHPKKNEEAQEEYKKNSQPSWLPPRRAFHKTTKDH